MPSLRILRQVASTRPVRHFLHETLPASTSPAKQAASGASPFHTSMLKWFYTKQS
ncbi:hypothetical protein LEMLEM_LOCUS22366 [Lemmus lemmus]